MLKISCADFAFPVLPHEKSLQLIKLMGIDYVDIGLFQDRSHIQPSDQLDEPEKKGSALKRKVNDLGLDLADIFLQTDLTLEHNNMNDPDPEVRRKLREQFLRFVEYVHAAGCNHASGLPGFDFGADSWAVCRDELAWRVAEAKKAGITYSVEHCLGSIMQSPSAAIQMCREAEGLTLTLDHSHTTFQGYSPRQVADLMPLASHMHARGAKYGEMQTSIARNDTDFSEVARQMKDTGFAGSLCIEYTYCDWENCNRTENVSETLILTDLFRKLFS